MTKEQIEKRNEIIKNKNLSLMNYLQYRTLFNTHTRTFEDNIKVFFIDIKIII